MFERQKALLKTSSDFLSTIEISSTSASTSTSTTTTTARALNDTLGLNNGTLVGASNVSGSGALALFLHLYSSAHARLCWYTWLIFGSFFVMLFLSLLVQFLFTGKNYDHRDSWHKREYSFLFSQLDYNENIRFKQKFEIFFSIKLKLVSNKL